jgi:hypothetical protein
MAVLAPSPTASPVPAPVPAPVPVPPVVPATRDSADVLHVLLVIQAAAGLVAMLGQLVMMGGSPLYLAVPILKAAALLTLSAFLFRGRRWAAITLAVLEGVTLLGLAVNAALGALPVLDFTVTLTGLITGLVLPVAILALCVPRLRRAVRS